MRQGPVETRWIVSALSCSWRYWGHAFFSSQGKELLRKIVSFLCWKEIFQTQSVLKLVLFPLYQAGGEERDRGWDGWTASPTQRTWVWTNSVRQWRTGKPDVLRLQTVGHDRASQESDTAEWAKSQMWPSEWTAITVPTVIQLNQGLGWEGCHTEQSLLSWGTRRQMFLEKILSVLLVSPSQCAGSHPCLGVCHLSLAHGGTWSLWPGQGTARSRHTVRVHWTTHGSTSGRHLLVCVYVYTVCVHWTTHGSTSGRHLLVCVCVCVCVCVYLAASGLSCGIQAL